ncbi:MAG: RHS repeat-associated core domain-containing protein, partial [Planctomycetota bacterium]
PTIYDANYTEISPSAVGNPYMFTARRADDETALYYYRARYYAFDIGRFLQADPVGYDDGLNVYAYCGNNPLIWADPYGLCKESLFDRAMNVVGPLTVPVAITCLTILYPPVGVALMMASGFMGGLYVGEGVITGTDIYGNPLSTHQRVIRTAVGTTAIALSAIGAARIDAAAAITTPSAPTPSPHGPRSAPDFVVTPGGQAIRVPSGATGPYPTRAPGFQYTGGSGGHGLESRVTGVRIMEANRYQGSRAVYMNVQGQTVNPATGQTVAPSHPAAHHYFDP